MAQIGSILRESRVRMGLSLKEVSESTKIRVKYLAALEDDDYGAIPGPTFVKAYLRTYANVLRLDPDSLIDDYRRTYERRQSSTNEYYDLTLEQVRDRSMRGRKKRPVRNTRRGYTLAGVLAVVAVVLLAFFGSRGGGGEPVVGPESVGGTTTTIIGEVTSTTLGPAGSTTTSEPIYTGSDVLLRIVATGDCALVIRRLDRDGESVFQGALRSGEETTAEGSKRYWVSIGNPDALQIYINKLLYASPDEAGMYYITETQIEPVQ
jgi:transcriptional regulator with XRE-family HTH domain